MSDLEVGLARTQEKLQAHLDSCEKTNQQVLKGIDQMRDEMKAGFKEAKEARGVLHDRIDTMDTRFRGRFIGALVMVISTLLAVAGFLIARSWPLLIG